MTVQSVCWSREERRVRAGWGLLVLIPLGWAAKAALATSNPGGRRAVVSPAGERALRKVALARLPLALLTALARGGLRIVVRGGLRHRSRRG